MLVGGATMTTVCTGIFSYYPAGKLRKESAGAGVERSAENLASQIEVSLGAAVGLLRQLATDTRIQQALVKENEIYTGLTPDEISQLTVKYKAIWEASDKPKEQLDALGRTRTAKILDDFVKANPGFHKLIALDKGGKALAAFGRLNSPFTHTQDEWNRTGKTDQVKATISEPSIGGDPVSPSVLICIPVSQTDAEDFEGELHAGPDRRYPGRGRPLRRA